MPIDLAGISNENEFYSEHYLTTIFEGDIEETFREWREAEKSGTTTPNRKLEKVGGLWRRLSVDYRNERDDSERLLIFRQFAHSWLDALGYERHSELQLDAEGKLIPVLARRSNHTGRDIVWVVEVPSPSGDDFPQDPLTVKFRCEQFENIESAQDITKRRKDTAEAAINKGIFALDAPPRFVILLSMSQAVLINRLKWSDSRLLRFRFDELFGRGDTTTIGATAALLQATSLAPDSGTALVDRIDEESHRHAYGVSQDLKFALREAIELLGNEAATLIVEKRRAQQKGVFTGEHALDPDRLTTECLRYMYRLLFMFFIEARPELSFAPMKAKAYRTGYSLESLRELELVPLESDEDKNGHFISDTLETLFNIVFEGTPAASLPESAAEEEFTFHPIRARLFSPEATDTYLSGLRFSNATMQRIVALLSLSKGDKRRGRGRISYAQLGISQLGAVYESLLSFSGFFASEDLIELKPKGKPAPAPLEAAFFTPQKRAADFDPDEIVYAGTSARIYPRGTFIYRLSGRNRENTASYYTPEPLARVLVKYALKDLLEGKTADDILKIKIVEPAMGSAAFLVEVINQLADKYLDLKQAEIKKRIPHEKYGYERQKVRAYLADRNVFGVDLNPIAVELGQISLWLNCLHEGGFAPWFDDQVQAGNSLVGARRAVFSASSLGAHRDADRWFRTKAREIGWGGETRRADEVWHFLLPDPDMSAYDQKIVRPLAPEAWETFAEWRRGFTAPLDADEIATLKRLSEVVDVLFSDVADRLDETRREINDEIAIWPAESKLGERHIDFQEKLQRLARFHGDGAKSTVSWRRLRTAMDAWCALWFWPIDNADLLPSRAAFLTDISLVLEGRMGGQVVTQKVFVTGSAQGRLFETVSLPAGKTSDALFRTEERVVELHKTDLFGDVDVEKLIHASNWLPTAMDIAARRRFMHFDLEFADVMRERGGFDLVIGNPPWIKPAWVDANVLSEKEPTFGIREVSADDVEKQKPSILAAGTAVRDWYIDNYVEVGGLQSFLSSPTTHPFVGTGQPNLYKCFIDLAFRITATGGFSALIHQDNHLTDPNAADFRRNWYRRIRRHYDFINVMTARMFVDVGHYERFSLNIYGGEEREVGFDHIGNLLLPSMIDDSYDHDGIGPLPGIKRPDGDWDTRGHHKRIVQIDRQALQTFASVIEEKDAPFDTTRFLFPFSTNTLAIFRSFGVDRTSFSDGAKPFQMRRLWDESFATKRDHIIESRVSFPSDVDEVILTGPLIYVGNPIYKSPDATGSKEREIDLDLTPDNYLPRTWYSRVADKQTYRHGITTLEWDTTKHHTDVYRIAFRRRLNLNMEHTLIGALIPPGVAHVNTIESLAFQDESKLIAAYPNWISLPFDFLVKVTGLADFRESSLRFFPWTPASDTAKHRVLRLSCLTEHYADLWNRHAANFEVLPWSHDDSRLAVETAHDHPSLKQWGRQAALRSDFARRLALVEVDVLVAHALGLTIDQLIEMYRTQFHVLDENERGTWYDMKGRIVWTCSKGLTGIGFKKLDGKKPSEKEWKESFADLDAGKMLECDVDVDFLKDGPTKIKRVFEAPFVVCDREADYRRAWAFFELHGNKKVA
jgi:methylase of polypeptide subunit release factors